MGLFSSFCEVVPSSFEYQPITALSLHILFINSSILLFLSPHLLIPLEKVSNSIQASNFKPILPEVKIVNNSEAMSTIF